MAGNRRAVIPGFPGLEMPNGNQDFFPAVYRAVVEDVADPQLRKRVRVRVAAVHPEELEPQYLPWAEIACMSSAQLAGDFFPVRVGDRVWVQFEGGDRRLPVVTGFWVARPSGLNDVPSDITVDYERTQKRWTRVDRVGNTLEMSEIPEEEWLRLVSGAAEVVLDQKDGSLLLRSGSGAVRTEGNSAETDVVAYFVTAEQVIISTEAKKLGAQGILQLMSDYEANIHALSPTGTGVVRLGGYLPRYKGVPAPATPGMQFRQTPQVEVVSRKLMLGSPAGRTLSGGPVPETETVTVDGVEVVISAKAATNSPSVATVKIQLTSTGEISIKSDTAVKVEAPNVEVKATTAKVDADVVEVEATAVTVDADTVDINGTTAINLN